MRGYWSKCYFLSSTQWDVSFSQEEGILVFHFFFAHLVSFQNKKVTQIEKYRIRFIYTTLKKIAFSLYIVTVVFSG